MTMTETRLRAPDPAPSPVPTDPPARGFRPPSRRRARIAFGVLLAAVAVGGNLLVYSSLDHKAEVLQVVRDVPAGEIVTAQDLRVVEVEVDRTVPTVSPDNLARVVNQYARVHIAAGSLLTDVLVQPAPLVADGQGVVAVEIRPSRIPAGLRERSRIMLVVSAADTAPALVTEGRIVSRGTENEGGVTGLSVEVRREDAAAIAAADDVRVALLDPGADPAYESGN